MRDVLAQRWVKTKTTYEQQNAKRIYYLSMEFLLGRSLANNITNLLLDPVVKEVIEKKDIDWLELIEQEPDAGLGNGGLGRLGGVFSRLDGHDAASGDGLWSALRIWDVSAVVGTAGSRSSPTTGCATADPWEIGRPHEKVEIKLNCTFELRDGRVAGDSGPAIDPVRHSL